MEDKMKWLMILFWFLGSMCNWYGNLKEVNRRKGGEFDKEINDIIFLVLGYVCIMI